MDFSTLEKRKYYCERELQLNRRLAPDIYLEVVSVCRSSDLKLSINNTGTVIDYAVKMLRLDNEKQMDVLLRKGKVSQEDIQILADVIGRFHQNCTIITTQDVLKIGWKFNDLGLEKSFLQESLGTWSSELIEADMVQSDNFLSANIALLKQRLKGGMFRDGHGDLHTRNIFLLTAPVIFDCIEFNDEYRQIDMLNEVAFLCMDLDSFGRQDLSARLLEHYLKYFQVSLSRQERNLFLYYKSYRANVRAKVNSLRAQELAGVDRSKALDECSRYLKLMHSYFENMET